MLTRRVVTSFACLCLSAAYVPAVTAEPDESLTRAKAGASPGSPRHTIYFELFGKGGLYGIGYDYRWGRYLGAGVVASGYEIDDERVLSLSPYVSAYPLSRGRHSLFAQAGPRIVDRRVKSPVPLWDGHHSTDVGAQLSSGYEYRGRMLVRAFLMGVAGKGGASPWGGVSLGVAF